MSDGSSVACEEFVRRLRAATKTAVHQASVETSFLLGLALSILVDSGEALEGYFASAAFVRSLASQALQLVTEPAPRNK